jgi:hypothetical protein
MAKLRHVFSLTSCSLRLDQFHVELSQTEPPISLESTPPCQDYSQQTKDLYVALISFSFAVIK